MKSNNLLITLLALTASATLAHAQGPPPGDRSGGDRERGRGNFEEFRQRMAERLKSALKVSDDEWAIINPLIEKVQEKQRESFGGRGFGGPPRSDRGDRGDRGGDSGRERSSGSPEREALRTALENEGTSPEELTAKLNALRESRKKSAAELAAARDELKKVLTIRQEAQLVSFGILE